MSHGWKTTTTSSDIEQGRSWLERENKKLKIDNDSVSNGVNIGGLKAGSRGVETNNRRWEAKKSFHCAFDGEEKVASCFFGESARVCNHDGMLFEFFFFLFCVIEFSGISFRMERKGKYSSYWELFDGVEIRSKSYEEEAWIAGSRYGDWKFKLKAFQPWIIAGCCRVLLQKESNAVIVSTKFTFIYSFRIELKSN
jgi:hypothetical protein